MNRMDRLIKIVKQEQELVRQGADCEQLCRHQDRLMQHLIRTGKNCPFDLFTIPESQINDAHRAVVAELKLEESTCGK